MKRIWIVLVSVTLCLAITACQPSNTATSTTTSITTTDTIITTTTTEGQTTSMTDGETTSTTDGQSTSTTVIDGTTVTATTTQVKVTTTATDRTTNTTSQTATAVTTNPVTTTTTTKGKTTTTTTTKPTTTTTKATEIESVSVYIGDVFFSDFDSAKTQYTYPLHPTVTAAPTVKLSNNAKVTQASSVNGTASFSLNGKTYQIKFEKKEVSTMLENTYYKLKVEKKLHIGYIGGSVTCGVGATDVAKNRWSSLTTEWFKRQFPDAEITETNVGIGGTDSELGCYRVLTDLNLKDENARPDIIFVDFAINDVYDDTDSDVYMEGLIRSIRAHAPETDIYLVIVADLGLQNKDSEKSKAQKKLARTYLLPYSEVGVQLWDAIVAENGGKKPTATSDAVWKKYFIDIVHPTDAGYALMGQYLTADLDTIFKAKTSVPSKVTTAYQPSQPICERPVPLLPRAEGFKGLSFKTARGVSINSDGMLVSSKVSASFSFEFTGTELKFLAICNTDCANLEVVVDGTITKTVSLYFREDRARVKTVAEGLEDKKHHVTVTVKRGQQGSSVKLKAVLTSGAHAEPLTLL